MKTIQNQQLHDVRGDDYKTIHMRVDDSKLGKLYGMLSNIYRNPIGSIVREYTSNAYDANIEAHNFKTLKWSELCKKYPWINDPTSKLAIDETEFVELKENLTKADKDEPIIVGVDKSKMEFFVKDYGIGLSPQRMEHVFFTYLNSTKEDTNDEIGGFGIGAKSALAYTNTFFITTIYNGVEYQYIMTKNEEGLPVGKIVSFSDTSDHNGTIIKIPIKEWDDMVTFAGEIEKKLLYIPNVFYHSNYEKCKINTFKLYKGPGWVYSTGQHDANTIHVVLDNIPYDIDWTELNMTPIFCPLGITFATGELTPTPSRESLLYSKSTKDLLIQRIDSVREFFYEKICEQNSPTDDLIAAYKSYSNKGDNFWFDTAKNHYINVRKLFTGYHKDNPSYSDFKPFVDLGLSFHTVYNDPYFKDAGGKGIGQILWPHHNSDGKYKSFAPDTYDSTRRYPLREIFNHLDKGSLAILNSSKAFNQMKAHYFLEKRYSSDPAKNQHRYIFMMGAFKRTLRNYKKYFRLERFPKDQWRTKILALQCIEDFLIKHSFDANVDPDPNWEKLYRAGKAKYAPKATPTVPVGVISLRKYEPYIRSSSSRAFTMRIEDISSGKDKIKTGDITNLGPCVIYADNTQVRELKFLRDIISGLYYEDTRNNSPLTKTSFIVCYKKHVNLLKSLNMENWHHIDDALEKDFKPVKRIATAFYLNRTFLKDYPYLRHDVSGQLLEDVIPDFAKDLDDILKYVKIHAEKYTAETLYTKDDDDLINNIIYMCQQRDDFDWGIMEKVARVKRILLKSPFLSIMLNGAVGDYRARNHPFSSFAWAKLLIKDGITVKPIYYSGFRQYSLYTMIKMEEEHEANGRGFRLFKHITLTGEETCFAEDEMGTEEYRKLLIEKDLIKIEQNETREGESPQNV